ncbi:hypothetical protein GC098_23220 [Paenibacillus sp. LMG 31458]|uniref:Uncharacterized protein n=1 Tax=Paenibacillus phytorum TaxID=2654977 RepID=A0ABX1Y2J3_9BACL|nr:hypothetical protein [Paenibacillus phytorum]NOU74270.1 hypothetical protein [Paenibacillus phytorum]
MKNKIMISACVSLVIIIGGSLSYSAYADNLPNAVKLSQLKNDFEKEKAIFESMPESKTDEDHAKVEKQGRKVKELGREAGLLEADLNPPDPKKELENNIRGLKGVLAETEYFKTRVDDAAYGEMYKEGIKIVEQKKRDLAEIEKELKDNKAPIEELVKRFEKVRDTKVLE